MTSTNIHVGLDEGNRNSSKVLKPPGGGSSDIFGSAVPNTPRSVKNHMASTIFNTGGTDVKNGNGHGLGESARRQPQTNSHNRLFGDSERPPVTPSKNHFKSSIPFAVDATDGAKAVNGNGTISNGNGHANGNGVAHANGNGTHEGSKIQNGGSTYTNGQKSDGNPVTGEGYKPGEINTTVPSLNGNRQVINKNRIPPGGFSSGLW